MKEKRGRAWEGKEKAVEGGERDGEKIKAEITQRELLYL